MLSYRQLLVNVKHKFEVLYLYRVTYITISASLDILNKSCTSYFNMNEYSFSKINQ